jgi:hypothetical protein
MRLLAIMESTNYTNNETYFLALPVEADEQAILKQAHKDSDFLRKKISTVNQLLSGIHCDEHYFRTLGQYERQITPFEKAGFSPIMHKWMIPFTPSIHAGTWLKIDNIAVKNIHKKATPEPNEEEFFTFINDPSRPLRHNPMVNHLINKHILVSIDKDQLSITHIDFTKTGNINSGALASIEGLFSTYLQFRSNIDCRLDNDVDYRTAYTLAAYGIKKSVKETVNS